MSEDTTYNGWANYETWNVASWIENEEGLAILVRHCKDYAEFRDMMREVCEGKSLAFETPDGVAWNDSGLDTEALDEMVAELRGE